MNHFGETLAKISRVVLVGLACGCLALATTPFDAQSKKESKEADKFRTQGEQARVAIEKARDQLQKTVAAYDALLGANDKKLQSSHKKLTQEVDKTGKVVEEGREKIAAFQETAKGFFVQWKEGVEAISTDSIRKASEQRLAAARNEFQNMSDNLTAAREEYEPLMQSLREQVMLTSQDLTVETVTLLREGVATELHAKAEKVFAGIERILSKEKASEEQVNEILDEEQAAPEADGV